MDVPATRVRSGLKNIAAPPKRTESTQTRPARPVIAEMKARQSAKIRELGQVLIDVGLRSLDDQANALGLPRSTAWTILKTCHKSYGLSAAVIERMLRSSKLPPRARAILVEYVEEKSFGLYGGSRKQQQRIRAPFDVSEPHSRELVRPHLQMGPELQVRLVLGQGSTAKQGAHPRR